MSPPSSSPSSPSSALPYFLVLLPSCLFTCIVGYTRIVLVGALLTSSQNLDKIWENISATQPRRSGWVYRGNNHVRVSMAIRKASSADCTRRIIDARNVPFVITLRSVSHPFPDLRCQHFVGRGASDDSRYAEGQGLRSAVCVHPSPPTPYPTQRRGEKPHHRLLLTCTSPERVCVLFSRISYSFSAFRWSCIDAESCRETTLLPTTSARF